MYRKCKVKNNKLWTNRGLTNTIAERDAAGTPIRKLSDKYNGPIAMLHCYLNHQKEGKTIPEKDFQGRKPVFTVEEERQLTNCIIRNIVCSYIEYNDHERDKKKFSL